MPRIPLITIRTKKPGEWIRNHLILVKEDYVMAMWSGYCEFLEQEGLTKPRYNSFSKYVYCLRKLGLIERTRQEEGKSRMIKRQYYRIVKRKQNSPAWDDAQKALFGRK